MTTRWTQVGLLMAAGHGTRMRSERPKVLEELSGQPMILWAARSLEGVGLDGIVCVVRPGSGVADALPRSWRVAEQTTGEGTAAAVRAGLEAVPEASVVLVQSGDQPLIPTRSIAALAEAVRADGADAAVLTAEVDDPRGMGRVIRGADGTIDAVIETKYEEAVAAEVLQLHEINLGVYAFRLCPLTGALERLALDASGELPLPAVISDLRRSGAKVSAVKLEDPRLAIGVNDRWQLMEAERFAQRMILEHHARNGVGFQQPDSTRVDAGVSIGPDTTVGPGVTLRGATTIGAGCELGPQTTITDSTLGDGVSAVHSFLVEAAVEDGATLGPFAYLRPGASVGARAKVGTFVEVKNARIGEGAKVPHLSYIGDAEIGAGSNIGAGNITANYDGARKHRTTIGARVRTSVDTSFVAPVSVGDGAYTGAGSVITEDVPDGALGIARSRQRNIEGYAERGKAERDE